MDDAALVFVREDGAAAERLAVALERAGVTVCRSASVFEDPQGYGAVVALFSPAAVRSRLVMDAALRAREEGRLVAVFIGLCPLPQAFSGIAMHDLSSWGGNADDAVVTAVAQQIRRARAVRSTKATLERGLGGARAYDEEPQGLEAPEYYTAPEDYPIEQRPTFGASYTNTAPSPSFGFSPPRVTPNAYPGYEDPRPSFTAYTPEQTHSAAYHDPYQDQQRYEPQAYSEPTYQPVAQYAPTQYTPPQAPAPRRFSGLTAADGFDEPQAPSRAWADEWLAQELRQRGAPAPAPNPAINRAAYRDFGGYGGGFPVLQSPAGNGYDAPYGQTQHSAPSYQAAPTQPQPAARPEPRPETRLPAVDPLLPTREDRLGYERPAGAQDPHGVGRPANDRQPRWRRPNSLFAALIAVGLAGGAAALVFAGGQTAPKAAYVSQPVEFVDATPQPASVGATPERVNLHSVSLTEALGDAEKAKSEPAKGPASEGDRGWERRRR